jgi:hypothetical protein
MPQAFTTSDKARSIAIQRAEGAGRTSALNYLRDDESMRGWKVGDSLDVFEDLCKYSDKVAPLIAKLSREYVPSKDRAPLRSALGAMQNELRKITRNEKASLVADKEHGPIMLDESDGKPVTRFIVKRTA